MSDRPICSYEGSQYSTEFWNETRAYEDGAERIAMRAMLPPQGKRLIEIGAGFGRLADLYAGYETVVIHDYARTQLEQAVARLGETAPGGKPHYLFVQADFYKLPFASGLFDAVTIIRTLHHAVDAPAVLKGLSEILAPNGALILEFANKQNLKALLRYWAHRQTWSPFDPQPVEFVKLNFDFHPRWIWQQLEQVGLHREAIRTVSHFRAGLLKRYLPTGLLVGMDGAVQFTGEFWQWTPSVFTRARAEAQKAAAPADLFFVCPECRAPLGSPPQAVFKCSCGRRWERQGAIYNFRDPVV